MTRNYKLTDFPLAPSDHMARTLKIGDTVRVVAIPDVDFHGFDALARTRYASLENRELSITEIDENGYVVFQIWYRNAADIRGTQGEPTGVNSFAIHAFHFDPRDLELA